MLNVSIAPDGKKYPLPTEQENEKEREILKQITADSGSWGGRSSPFKAWALWAV